MRERRQHFAGGVAAGLVITTAIVALWLIGTGADEVLSASNGGRAAEPAPELPAAAVAGAAVASPTRPLVEPDVILPSESVAPVVAPVIDEPGEILPGHISGRVVRLADGYGLGGALVSIDARAGTGFSGFVSEKVDQDGGFDLPVPPQAHGSDALRVTGNAGGRHYDQSIPLREFLRSGRGELVVDTGWCLRVSVIWADEQPADGAQVSIQLDESPDRPLAKPGPWELRRWTGSTAEAVYFADLSHELRSLEVSASRRLGKDVCATAPLLVHAPDGAGKVSRLLVLPCPKPPDPTPQVRR